MSQRIYQGRTNNHLNWVMVDATDFATPESALSAATKIKVYGQLRSATGTNFVSSGTGSLTNDITHVGASVLGIYHIALAKADISDASAAFYDTYIVSLSATGAAYQTLVVDGIRDDGSYVSNVLSYLSNMASNASAIFSDILSQTLLATSAASDAASAAQQANSRVLLNLSRISDVASFLVVMSGIQSDIYSNLVAGVAVSASDMSDLRSAITAVTATVSASDISDIASAVKATLASDLSDILSAAVQTNSRVLLNQSRISDIYSLMSDVQSDFQSRVPKLVATNSQVSDLASDLRSFLVVMSGIQSDIYSAVLVTQSAASDAASAAQQANSRVLVAQSNLSDIYSLLSDVGSDIIVMSGIVSDIFSAITSTRAEPAQGAPAATASPFSKIDYLYKAWRNKTDQTATQYSLYNDDAATIDHKATFADDGTTATRGEVATGP